MNVQAEMPKDNPIRIAWEAYRATDDYANTRAWALKEAHVDGSLWAAFIAGYGAAPNAPAPRPQGDASPSLTDLRKEVLQFITNNADDVTHKYLVSLGWLAPQVSVGGEVDPEELRLALGEIAVRVCDNPSMVATCRLIDGKLAGLSTPRHPDDVAVDAFAAAMKEKLAAARAKGRGGWDNKADCTNARLSDMLRGHVAKGDPRDVANFACFLWNRGESIAPAQARPDGGKPFAWAKAVDVERMQTGRLHGGRLGLYVGEVPDDDCTVPIYLRPAPAPDVARLVEACKLADQFFDGQDDYWMWDDGTTFPGSTIREALAPFTTTQHGSGSEAASA